MKAGIVPFAIDTTRKHTNSVGGVAITPEERGMEQYRKAVEAVAIPSRAQELKEELARSSLDDLQLQLQREHNKTKKRRIRKQIASF